MKRLKESGIATAIQYPKALPFLEAYEDFGHKAEDFPAAAQAQDEILSLPMFPELQKDEIDYICTTLKSAL